MYQLIIILVGCISLTVLYLGYYINNFVNQQQITNLLLQNSIVNDKSFNVLAGSGENQTNWVIKGDNIGNLCFGNPKFFACLERVTGNLISPPIIGSQTQNAVLPIPPINSVNLS